MTSRMRLLLPPVSLALLGACATATSEVVPARATRRTSGYEVREAITEAPDSSGMAFDAEQGYLSEADAEEAIKRRWRQLVGCYEQAGPVRDFASGVVKLRFVVDGDGRAVDVYVLESHLGSFEVERCLVSVGRSIVFPRPQGGGRTPVEYSMEFRSSGGIPVVDLPDGELTGQLSTWLPRLAAECRDLAVADVMVTLYIEPHGNVRSVGLASAASLSDEAALCLSRSLLRWIVRLEGPSALRRVQVALRREDLLNAPKPPEGPPPDRRLNQGRRGGGRR